MDTNGVAAHQTEKENAREEDGQGDPEDFVWRNLGLDCTAVIGAIGRGQEERVKNVSAGDISYGEGRRTASDRRDGDHELGQGGRDCG